MNILDDLIPAEDTPPEPQILWSIPQINIFEAIKETGDDLLIEAGAGCAKTTTIVEAMKYSQGNAIFLAFNKAIKDDIAARGPPGDVMTLNALGFKVVRDTNWKARKRVEMNPKKSLDLLKTVMEPDQFREYGYTLSRLIGLAKNNCVGVEHPATSQNFVDLMDSYQVDIPEDLEEHFSYIVLDAWNKLLSDTTSLDFDDQLFWPILYGWEFPQYGEVFVDEAQDLTPIQYMMLRSLKFGRGVSAHFDSDTRITAVGDRFQAIYGFRGATTKSMDLLQTEFSMSELPLSITYRCPLEVVKLANTINPALEAASGAPTGLVCPPTKEDPQLFSDYTMVLCRNNAPLFRAILRHVRAKKPCRVRSNFLESFANFIKMFKVTDTVELRAKLRAWYDKEAEACKAKKQAGKLLGITDRYETCVMLAKEYPTVYAMVSMVERLGISNSGPIFSTIHKAKGLEAPHVYLLRPDLLPEPDTIAVDEQHRQDLNLLYVAITRAKQSFSWGVSLC